MSTDLQPGSLTQLWFDPASTAAMQTAIWAGGPTWTETVLSRLQSQGYDVMSIADRGLQTDPNNPNQELEVIEVGIAPSSTTASAGYQLEPQPAQLVVAAVAVSVIVAAIAAVLVANRVGLTVEYVVNALTSSTPGSPGANVGAGIKFGAEALVIAAIAAVIVAAHGKRGI